MKSTTLLRIGYARIGLVLLLIGFSGTAHAQPSVIPDTYTLIAHYPLQENANDVTGQNDPMALLNAPFESNGGIRLSGTYNASDATTPALDALNFDAFAISADFKIVETGHPIVVGGYYWRWMGAWVFDDSTLYMEANNYAFIQRSQGRVILDSLYTLTMLYDGQAQRGRWFLDNTEVGNGEFSLTHGDDKTITATHAGLGYVHNGVFSNLRIYTGNTSTSIEEEAIPNAFALSPVYPNPFNPEARFTLTVAQTQTVRLALYDVTGREVAVLHEGVLASSTTHGFTLQGRDLPSGLYLIRAVGETVSDVQSVMLAK